MHDFSGWSGLIVLQPEQKNITGLFVFKDKTGNKKTVFVLLADHDQNWINQKNEKKWRRTLTIYPARKNSEKRYIKENVTI